MLSAQKEEEYSLVFLKIRSLEKALKVQRFLIKQISLTRDSNELQKYEKELTSITLFIKKMKAGY